MFERTDDGIIETIGKDNKLIDLIEEQDLVNHRIVEAKIYLEYCKEWVLYFSASEYIRDEEIESVLTKEEIKQKVFRRKR